jgi:hypothetical protein
LPVVLVAVFLTGLDFFIVAVTTGLQVGNALGVSLIGLIFYRVLADGTGAAGYSDAFAESLYFLLAVSAAFAVLA